MGFLKPAKNSTAVAICRRFAFEAGIEWAGGLSLGGGGAVARKQTRRRRRHVAERTESAGFGGK